MRSDGYGFQFYFNFYGWYGTVSSSCGGVSSSMREKEGRSRVRLFSFLIENSPYRPLLLFSLPLLLSFVVFNKEVIMLEILCHCRSCRSIPILLLVSLQDYHATNDELCKKLLIMTTIISCMLSTIVHTNN